MKKLFTLLCLCILFLFANAQCPLTNGGFENGLSGWNVTGDVQISTDARIGSSAAEICSAQTGINQVFQTQPGKNYDVSFWYNTASDHSLSVYQIRALDSNWTPLEIPGSNGIIYATAGGLIAQTNGSYLSSIEFKMTTPPNAAWFQVSIWNEQGGCILIDDFKVCESGTPPPNGCTNDTEAPIVSGCPIDINEVTSGNSTNVSWIPPTATDNCGTPAFVASRGPGSFTIGTTPVTYTATDAANNSSFCFFTVTVTQNPPPPSGGGNLVLEATDATINQWSSGQVEFRVRNIGSETIFDAEVEFNLGPNVRLVGGNEYESYQNTPVRQFWSNNPTWEAGSFASGGVKSIRFNVYSITNDPMYIYGQVSSATGNDVNSTPGNGTPPTPNEDDEIIARINGGTPPPPPPPSGNADLTISNLVLDNLSVKTGEVLNYNFDISNIGTANVPQNFIVRAYLSTDGDISNDDIQDGIVPTGNFDAGLLVADVPGASTINLPEGDYYLLLRVDADNQVNESDETNNDLQANIQFTVDNTPGGNGSACDKTVGNNATSLNCIEPVPGTNNIRLVYNRQDDQVVTVLNPNLDVVSSSTQSFPASAKFVLDDVTLTKINADGSVAYTRTVPQAFADRFAYRPQIIEFMGGYVFFGQLDDPVALKGIRTDNNFNVITEQNVAISNDPLRNSVRSVQIVNGNNIAFISGSNITFGSSATLYLWDASLNELDNLSLFSGVWQGGASLFENACNRWTVTDGVGLGYCKSGGCYRRGNRDVDFDNNRINVNTFSGLEHRTTLGIGYENRNWTTTTSDGGNIRATRNQDLLGFNNPVPDDAQVNFKKYDANSNLQWDRNYLISDWQFITQIRDINGEIYITKLVDGEMIISDLECYDLPSNLPDLVITDVNAPASAVEGSSFNLSYTLRNTGTLASQGSIVGLYLSRDQQLGFDAPLRNVFPQYQSINPDGSIDVNIMVTANTNRIGTNYLLLVADAQAQNVESNEDNNLIVIPIEITEPNTGGVDLEISSNLPNSTPAQWSVFTPTVTITNNGGATATGVEIYFGPSDGAIFQGGNEGTVSQGTFRAWANTWDVGTLAAGQSATLDVNLFRLIAGQFVMYTQVTGLNEPDVDSAPDNGTCCAGGEDDETPIYVGAAANGISNRSSIVENLGNQPFAIVNAMPNPFTNDFKLQIFSNENQESEITVMNAMGQAIFKKEVNLNKGLNTIPMNLDSDASGILMVKMTPFHPYLRQIRVMRVRD